MERLSLDTLPEEDTLVVLSYLDRSSLVRAGTTCQRLNRIAKDDQLWRPLSALFDPPLDGSLTTDWRNRFIRRWRSERAWCDLFHKIDWHTVAEEEGTFLTVASVIGNGRPSLLTWSSNHFLSVRQVDTDGTHRALFHQQYRMITRKITSVTVVTWKGRSFAVIGLQNGSISLWNPDTQKPVRALRGHDSAMVGCDWREPCLASLSGDGKVCLWDLDQEPGSELLSAFHDPDDSIIQAKVVHTKGMVEVVTRSVTDRAGSVTGKIKIWSFVDEAMKSRLPISDPWDADVAGLDVIECGERFLLAARSRWHRVTIFGVDDTGELALIQTLEPGLLAGLIADSSGQYLIGWPGEDGKEVFIWPLDTTKRPPVGEPAIKLTEFSITLGVNWEQDFSGPVLGVAPLYLKGKLHLVVSHPKRITLWRLSDDKQLQHVRSFRRRTSTVPVQPIDFGGTLCLVDGPRGYRVDIWAPVVQEPTNWCQRLLSAFAALLVPAAAITYTAYLNPEGFWLWLGYE